MSRPALPPASAPERGAVAQRLAEAVDKIGGRAKAAAATKRSPSAVSLWTTGETVPDLFTLRILARESGFSVDYLVALDLRDDARPLEERVLALETLTADHSDRLSVHQDRIEALDHSLADAARRAAVEPALVAPAPATPIRSRHRR